MSNKNLKFPTKFLPSENVIAHVAPLIHRYCLKFNPEENQHYTLPAEAVPRDFLQWFTTTFNNIGVDSLEIIYTPAGKISAAETKDNFVKINHVYSNSGVNVSLVPAKEHNIDNSSNTAGSWSFCVVPSSKPGAKLEFNESLKVFKDYI